MAKDIKKIILTSTQLNEVFKKINEDTTMNISVKAKDNNASSFAAAMSDPTTISDIQKARNVGDTDVTVSSAESSDEQPTINVDVPKGQSPAQALNDLGADANAMIQNGSKAKFTGDGVGTYESKSYTKKAIEEARLKKMYVEGRKFTKKSLNEAFLLEAEIEDKIESMPVGKVLAAYKVLGGNPQDLESEWDIASAIINKYNESSPELQERFRELIG